MTPNRFFALYLAAYVAAFAALVVSGRVWWATLLAVAVLALAPWAASWAHRRWPD